MVVSLTHEPLALAAIFDNRTCVEAFHWPRVYTRAPLQCFSCQRWWPMTSDAIYLYYVFHYNFFFENLNTVIDALLLNCYVLNEIHVNRKSFCLQLMFVSRILIMIPMRENNILYPWCKLYIYLTDNHFVCHLYWCTQKESNKIPCSRVLMPFLIWLYQNNECIDDVMTWVR